MTIDPCKNGDLLSALLDNELSQEESTAVRRHMGTCPSCQRQFDILAKADTAIQDMATIEPSADFDRTFWRKVAELEKPGKSLAWYGFLLTGWRPVMATGMLAVLTSFIFIYAGQKGKVTPEEVVIAQNIELLKDYEIINDLDLLENLDAIEKTKGSR